ncbi:MAG TPA: hypothetical protein V6D33_12640 [Cyanophyceae cyanobacterium]
MTDELVMVSGVYYTTFRVLREQESFVKLVSFFPCYTPSGGFEYWELWARKKQVFPIVQRSLSSADYQHDFGEGDRVLYVGQNPMRAKRLQDVVLTVKAIHPKDISCIADGCSHLEFFYPWELVYELDF